MYLMSLIYFGLRINMNDPEKNFPGKYGSCLFWFRNLRSDTLRFTQKSFLDFYDSEIYNLRHFFPNEYGSKKNFPGKYYFECFQISEFYGLGLYGMRRKDFQIFKDHTFRFFSLNFTVREDIFWRFTISRQYSYS